MQYTLLATDYDNTLAENGRVSDSALAALERWRSTGRRLLLVTGRHMPDLPGVFPQFRQFDAVVAENGALLYLPGSDEERLLGAPPPPALLDALRSQGVTPLIAGRGIISTARHFEDVVRAEVARLSTDWRLMANKDDLMLLPPAVNKASGLQAALEVLGATPAEVVGVGDAENDLDMLEICGYAAAVANALPAVQSQVAYVAQAAYGAGVAELIAYLLEPTEQ